MNGHSARYEEKRESRCNWYWASKAERPHLSLPAHLGEWRRRRMSEIKTADRSLNVIYKSVLFCTHPFIKPTSDWVSRWKEKLKGIKDLRRERESSQPQYYSQFSVKPKSHLQNRPSRTHEIRISSFTLVCLRRLLPSHRTKCTSRPRFKVALLLRKTVKSEVEKKNQ